MAALAGKPGLFQAIGLAILIIAPTAAMALSTSLTGAAPARRHPRRGHRGDGALGFHITHVYGLTEVYGPAVACAWRDEWDGRSDDQRARHKARQGVPTPCSTI